MLGVALGWTPPAFSAQTLNRLIFNVDPALARKPWTLLCRFRSGKFPQSKVAPSERLALARSQTLPWR